MSFLTTGPFPANFKPTTTTVQAKEEIKREEMNKEEIDNEAIELGEDGKPSKKALKKLEAKKAKEQKKQETAERLNKEQSERDSQDFSKELYGQHPLNQSTERTQRVWTKLAKVDESMADKEILIRARLQTSRGTGKVCFVILRQQMHTIQGVLTVDEKVISKQMVKFVGGLPKECIVDVYGTLKKTVESVESCSFNSLEIQIGKLFVASMSDPRLPLLIEDATRQESEDAPSVKQDTRLDNRWLDLRTITNQAIFKLQSAVCRIYRDFLLGEGFIEIHTPKIISAASEGGANVFKLNYFKGEAYLAQSPQLYKQMAICSDFERVFEIAPVFRAENSFTHRHMTEFVGLDLEMAFNEHYHEVLDVFDNLFVNLFRTLETQYKTEIDIIRKQYPCEPFKFKVPSLRLKFSEGIALLKEKGVQIDDLADMDTPTEKLLGKIIKEKYDTDFYMLDKFPLGIRPFYTMPDPNLPGYSNSYDFFMRGEEIMSGAQRIHDPTLLKERADQHGVNIQTIQAYLDSFKYGCPPHAGGGVGLERVIMLYLGLHNIRRTSMFPRDPSRITP